MSLNFNELFRTSFYRLNEEDKFLYAILQYYRKDGGYERTKKEGAYRFMQCVYSSIEFKKEK